MSQVAGQHQQAFLARRQEFLDSLAEVLSHEFYAHWIPLAQTFYRETKTVTADKKTTRIKQALEFVSNWIDDVRIRLLRDVARFVQRNQRDFSGDAKSWMERCCTEIWGAVISEEIYRDWFASACDNSSNAEKWRAPLWLAIALGIPDEHIRLDEQPEQTESVEASGRNVKEFDDCERLDLETTDKLIEFNFAAQELGRSLGCSEREGKEIAELLVLAGQGAKLPAGLLAPQEDSAPTTPHALGQQKFFSPTSKRVRRVRSKANDEKEREEEIRRISKLGLKGIHYCKEMDDSKITIPANWVAKGCPDTYVKAYLAGPPWRHRIFNEKWRLSKPERKTRS